MRALSDALALFVAAQHVAFLVFEMFLFTRPIGLKIFRLTPEAATAGAVLAKNQGLYNGFLAAGLLWSVVSSGAEAMPMRWFFASCVVIAGVYGGATANVRILWIQAVPGALALAAAWLAA